MEDPRQEHLRGWVRQILQNPELELRQVAGDASFRRYFRVHGADRTWIAMDAPPENEPLQTFLAVNAHLQKAGVHVPDIQVENEADGFLLLEDLGDTQYLQSLDEESADSLYGDALDALLRIQALPQGPLPPYDAEQLRLELDRFTDWYLGCHLGWELNREDQLMIETAWQLLINCALEQPCVAVHRDYHSRNLMVAEPNPGIIDHQDAMWGPVTYDLVSLLRDCYIAWPDERVLGWAEQYRQRAIQLGILDEGVDSERFMEWFDWMGVQRHLKAVGIFARLCHRDDKPSFLDDVPRVLRYVQDVCAKYPSLQPLADLVARLPEP
ncbi:MAG: phosphotransferase [Gammaproteobacteria bacterium]|nr:phosphotransferase [Gammaproteobacteria bacterium]